MNKKIYFDNASTTKIDKKVLKKMFYYLNNNYGNYSSNNYNGLKVKKKIDKIKQKISKLLKCKKKEIIFTSGATEANNLAIKGFAFSNEKKKNFLTFNIEHKSVLNTYKKIEGFGHKVFYLEAKKNGIYNLKKMQEKIKKKKIDMISILWVNNEIGVIQDIKKIGKICKDNNVLLHIDGTQALGKIKINISEYNIDFFSASAHKIHGPQGIGFLYKNQKIKICSEIQGGGQEMNIRSGTLATHQIIGLGKAIEISIKEIKKNNKKISKISKFLIKNLIKIEDVKINGSIKKRIPHNINISFGSVEGESLMLKMNNISLSSGSACNSSSLEPSYVLKNIGVPTYMIHNSIRISLGKYNSMREAKYFIKKVKKSLKELRKISPLWDMYKKGIKIKNFSNEIQ
ncbi:aminotransferase class V-fold PLP-dependent enzyme [Candidatus Vidania fulgoroideae]|uniref:cysteine desulfurase n=1 Tax=Candidatus Vidania fulgoroideorum TaxID=881286 RepID=A0AAX3NA72_9PROT|nr:aminotransferase class V-fold PLP-dependent enzyme [Candidatus Vidania fulgoroideae]